MRKPGVPTREMFLFTSLLILYICGCTWRSAFVTAHKLIVIVKPRLLLSSFWTRSVALESMGMLPSSFNVRSRSKDSSLNSEPRSTVPKNLPMAPTKSRWKAKAERTGSENGKNIYHVYVIFFSRTTYCGRVFSQTTPDSIIQPNAIWKRRVQSVFLAGSGFPVRLQTGSRPENILD